MFPHHKIKFRILVDLCMWLGDCRQCENIGCVILLVKRDVKQYKSRLLHSTKNLDMICFHSYVVGSSHSWFKNVTRMFRIFAFKFAFYPQPFRSIFFLRIHHDLAF